MRPSALRAPRAFRRAILIYVLTIVIPVGLLLWLGLQSFDRQREALAMLTAEKVATAIDVRTREAADSAFENRSHPIAAHFFEMRGGEVVQPVLRAPLPAILPGPFRDAEQIELTRPDLALSAYQKLAADPPDAAVALSRVARCLTTLGRHKEAARVWRRIVKEHPDARDPSGRPYGIVAAMQSGETDGLLEKIVAGRWDLSGDHAAYFVGELGNRNADRYLERYAVARDVAAGFRPVGNLREGQVGSDVVAGRRIFYRIDGDRVIGFAADLAWIDALRADVQRELGVEQSETRDLRLYGGALAVVSLLLSAGVVMLVRDTSRDARTTQLRADFVSGVSHELKTPITLVRLYGETLLRHAALSDAERRDFYRIITRESARLGRLVDQILAFSRIERGELRYELTEGDLAPLVNGLLDDYRDWLEQGGFRIARQVPVASLPVRFDDAAIAQALVNLLDNAAKYSGSSRAIAVRLEVRDRDVAIEVQDQGPGIPRDQQARIFDRFYRAPAGSGKGGYGLGLFMVRHIMNAHGGRVEVESEPGRGSRFTLVFPAVAT